MVRRAIIRLWVRRGLEGLFVAILAVGMMATPAFAARPTQPGNGGNGGNGGGGSKGGNGGGGGTSTPTGNDVSYPQCGSSLPSSPAFAIVGVNGGLADDQNPCLGPVSSSSYTSYTQSELYWALTAATGATKQPKASLYVNTADPGNVYNGTVITDWPTSDVVPATGATAQPPTTLGTCSSSNEYSYACAWQYGYNMAAQDAVWLTDAAQAINQQTPPDQVPVLPSSYSWWLDVETANTWQPDTTMNSWDLQGMVQALEDVNVPGSAIGVYSTSSQWGTIAGGAPGLLSGLANWIPGARRLSEAQSNCTQPSFTGGKVTVTQWFAKPVDADYSCIG